MKLYRMQSLKLWVEGAYENEDLAIKDLADQLLLAHRCVYPRVSVSVDLKLKIGSSKKDWQTIKSLRVFPFKKEHWKPIENFVPQPCEFNYLLM